MKKILLFPFNGNAREAVSVLGDINRAGRQWEIVGFFDDDPAKKGKRFGGYSVLGGREVLAKHSDALILAVPGRPDNYSKRAEIIKGLGVSKENFAVVIHPSAQVGVGCKVGRNCLLLANVVLTANTVVGDHVVVLPNTVISHDSIIGDYCMLGSNISVSGSVSIGAGSYIGSGAKIIQEVSIGCGALVGIGSVVLDNVPDGATVVGNPARKIVH